MTLVSARFTRAAGLVFAALLGLAAGAFAALADTSASAVRLTVLVDNAVAQPGVKVVWGFACLVEAGGHTVLFDTGADPAVLRDNLAALKIDPARIEAVVISHYHADHTWGAPGLGVRPGVRVYTPHAFDRHLKEVQALEAAGLVRVPVTKATPLFAGLTVSEPLRFGGANADTWEQCLTVDTAAGLVVVAGCSHPGIGPMLEQVRRQSGRPLHLVIGGLHLGGKPAAELRSIATTMQALGVTHVSPTHCTGEAAGAVFREVFGDRCVEAGAGRVIDLPLPPVPPAGTAAEARAALEAYVVDFCTNRDPRALERALTPTMIYHYNGERLGGAPADHLGYLKDFGGAFPDLVGRIDQFTFAGDLGAAVTSWSGTHRGELAGIAATGHKPVAPTGRAWTWTVNYLFRVEDGKIAELWEAWDEGGLYRRLSQPEPPPKT